MNKPTACSALEWNAMLGLADQLKRDGHYRDHLLIIVGSHFGLRIGDLLALRWCDFDNTDEVVIREGKTNKTRVIRINSRVVECVSFCKRQLDVSNTEEPLFANRSGKPMSVSYINKRLKWIFARYRVKTQNASSHTLRKTFGMRVYQMHGESDKALVFLSEVFGHASTATTRRYLGITKKQIADLYMTL